RAHQGDARDAAQDAAGQVAAGHQGALEAPALRGHLRVAGDAEPERRLGGVLRDAARVAAGVALQRLHRLDQLGRPPPVADPPAAARAPRRAAGVRRYPSAADNAALTVRPPATVTIEP